MNIIVINIYFSRGEIFILVQNCGSNPFHVFPTIPIAQIVILPYQPVTIQPVSHLSSTIRGCLGLGRMTDSHVAGHGPSGSSNPDRGTLDQSSSLPRVQTFLAPR